MSASNRPRRRLSTRQEAAEHFSVTPRTIGNWISKGLITGYMLPNLRGVRVDIDEIERALRSVPTTVMRTPRSSFGPNARIVAVPRRDDAETVTPPKGGAR